MSNRLQVILIILLSLTLAMGVITSAAQKDTQEKTLSGKLTLNEMVTYKSFDSYQQAPALKKLVDQGKLPSLEARLPQEPKVWKKGTMVDGIGTYGGVWRDTFGATATGWLFAAGQTMGYYGINQIMQETLVTTGPMWMLKSPEPIPHLAQSWEWSEDGKTLTMHLMEGVKWSDGVEFTAEDVLFTYYDNLLEDHVPYGGPGPWTFGGKLTELEKVDKYTIKWHFGKAFPVRVFFEMDYASFPITPAHVYKQYHPNYNPDMSWQDYTTSTPPEALPAVVLGPWVPVSYKPDEMMVFERNPYYWIVDEDGKQLPYFDEVRFFEARNMETRTLNLLAGSTDRSHIHSPKLFSLALKTEKEPKSHFELQWTPTYNSYELFLNQSLYAGVDSDRDRALRQLFRKKKFRQAISHAVDREGIAKAAFPGPATKPYYGGYPQASPYYDEGKVVKYSYDKDQARKLLSELGFKDTDGDGIRNWPEDSSLAGKELSIEAITTANVTTLGEIGETLVPLLRDVGIKLHLKILKGPIISSRTDTGDFEMMISRTMRLTPWATPEGVGTMGPNSPTWHQEGPEGNRELQPFEVEIKDLLQSTATMTDATERKESLSEVLNIFTENVYTVGVYQKADLLGVAKRFKNIADDAVMYLWQWTPTSNPIETFWTPKGEQLKARHLDQIPTLETYKAQDWYLVE